MYLSTYLSQFVGLSLDSLVAFVSLFTLIVRTWHVPCEEEKEGRSRLTNPLVDNRYPVRRLQRI